MRVDKRAVTHAGALAALALATATAAAAPIRVLGISGPSGRAPAGRMGLHGAPSAEPSLAVAPAEDRATAGEDAPAETCVGEAGIGSSSEAVGSSGEACGDPAVLRMSGGQAMDHVALARPSADEPTGDPTAVPDSSKVSVNPLDALLGPIWQWLNKPDAKVKDMSLEGLGREVSAAGLAPQWIDPGEDDVVGADDMMRAFAHALEQQDQLFENLKSVLPADDGVKSLESEWQELKEEVRTAEAPLPGILELAPTQTLRGMLDALQNKQKFLSARVQGLHADDATSLACGSLNMAGPDLSTIFRAIPSAPSAVTSFMSHAVRP